METGMEGNWGKVWGTRCAGGGTDRADGVWGRGLMHGIIVLLIYQT